MKKVVRCLKCEKACVDLGVGFCSTPCLWCTYFNFEVSKDDGCTFGVKGEPKYKLVRDIPVDIESHAIVNGWW